jgi:hypothetical protein
MFEMMSFIELWRARVACAKRSNASVDGRTLPPSMGAM